MSRTTAPEIEATENDVRTAPPPQRERRFVYGGEPGGGSTEFLTRGNKPIKRRKKSPFRIVALIAAISLVIVLYVWNKITVNRLAVEIDALEIRLGKLQAVNAKYGGIIDEKSNLDRVTKMAKEKLGMIEAPEQPTYFEVDNYEPRPQGEGSR